MVRDIVDIIRDKIEERIESIGYELVDVELKQGKYNKLNLNILIHKPGGVTVEDCINVNYETTYDIDELDYFKDKSYNLNVSSPGLDRPLKTQKDFDRNIGKEIDLVTLQEDKTIRHKGTIKEANDDEVVIDSETGIINIKYNDIKKALLKIKF